MIRQLIPGIEPGDLLGKTEIPFHPSMDIHDASKVQTFLTSPRKYFYQYILGWGMESANIHLVFGSAMHEALEVLYHSLDPDNELGLEPYSFEAVEAANAAFLSVFRDTFPNEMLDTQFGAKSPGNAYQALAEYVIRWRKDVHDLEMLFTETAFSVPVSDTRIMHGKMDVILREKRTGLLLSHEHKTTGRKTQSWLDKWGVMVQPALYEHALHVMLGIILEGSGVKGVTINGLILRQSENELIRIPVGRSGQMMEQSLWAINHWLDQIQWNTENMLNTSPDDDYMAAFPCNGQTCPTTSYNGCPFSDFCQHWPNPLRQAQNGPPPGFTQGYWDPRRIEETADKVVHVGQEKP